MKLPSTIISIALVLFMAFSAYGWGFKLPKTMVEERLQRHNTQVHEVQAIQHAEIMTEQYTARQERNQLKRDVEFLIRLECQRTDREILEAAGMIPRCRELGVERWRE